MYLTQTLHRTLQQNPDRPATIYRGRVRTVSESADRIAKSRGYVTKILSTSLLE